MTDLADVNVMVAACAPLIQPIPDVPETPIAI